MYNVQYHLILTIKQGGEGVTVWTDVSTSQTSSGGSLLIIRLLKLTHAKRTMVQHAEVNLSQSS